VKSTTCYSEVLDSLKKTIGSEEECASAAEKLEKYTSLQNASIDKAKELIKGKDVERVNLPYSCVKTEGDKLEVYVPWTGSADEMSILILGLLRNITCKKVKINTLLKDYDNPALALDTSEQKFLLGMWCAVDNNDEAYRKSFNSKATPGQLGYSCAIIECLVKYCNNNKKSDIYKKTIPPEFLQGSGSGQDKKILHQYLSKIKAKCTTSSQGHLMVTLEKLLTIWADEQQSKGRDAAAQNKLPWRKLEEEAIPHITSECKDPNNKKKKIFTCNEESYWNSSTGEMFLKSEAAIIKRVNAAYAAARTTMKDIWTDAPATTQYQIYDSTKKLLTKLYTDQKSFHSKLSNLHVKRRKIMMHILEKSISKKDSKTPGKFYVEISPEFKKIMDRTRWKKYASWFNPYDVFTMCVDAGLVDGLDWRNRSSSVDDKTQGCVTALHSTYKIWLKSWDINETKVDDNRDDLSEYNRYDCLTKLDLDDEPVT